MAGLGIGTRFYRLDRPRPPTGRCPSTQVRPVTPGFFRTMGIPLRAGRDFTDADRDGAPAVAIVSEGAVTPAVPGRGSARQAPAGQRPRRRTASRSRSSASSATSRWHRSTAETRARRLPAALAAVDRPDDVRGAHRRAAAVAGDHRRRRRARARSRGAAGRSCTMEEVVSATLARPRTVSVLLTAFALMALVLAGGRRLRRDGVFGLAAHPRDRRAHGARRDRRIGLPDGARAGAAPRRRSVSSPGWSPRRC